MWDLLLLLLAYADYVPYELSQSTDSSSAVCSLFSSSSNFVRRRDSTMWDSVWVAPRMHRSLSAPAPQCPWFVLKWFRAHHCFLTRPNPGGWIVGSWTKSQLTTEAELQSLCHWEMWGQWMLRVVMMTKMTLRAHDEVNHVTTNEVDEMNLEVDSDVEVMHV